MPQATCLKDLMRIRAHNQSYLDSINANLGTALGFKKHTGQPVSDEPAVIVFVPQKINPKWLPGSQILHERLEGPDGLWCPIDVVEGGKSNAPKDVEPAFDELSERLRGWDDKVWVGSQIAHWVDQKSGSYSMGTIGGFARHKRTGKLGLLTNQHVAIEPEQKLYHPVPWGKHMATTQETKEYVEDQDWYVDQVDEPETFVRVDCAFAELAPEFDPADVDPRLMGVGKLGLTEHISLENMDIINRKVLRVGRTTGLRRGTVVAFGYEFSDQSGATAYTDLLILGDAEIPFSTHGDSGSLIVTDDSEHRPIGLLWGGWQEKLRTGHAQENWTYGIALSRVLDALDIELVTEL